MTLKIAHIVHICAEGELNGLHKLKKLVRPQGVVQELHKPGVVSAIAHLHIRVFLA